MSLTMGLRGWVPAVAHYENRPGDKAGLSATSPGGGEDRPLSGRTLWCQAQPERGRMEGTWLCVAYLHACAHILARAFPVTFVIK